MKVSEWKVCGCPETAQGYSPQEKRAQVVFSLPGRARLTATVLWIMKGFYQNIWSKDKSFVFWSEGRMQWFDWHRKELGGRGPAAELGQCCASCTQCVRKGDWAFEKTLCAPCLWTAWWLFKNTLARVNSQQLLPALHVEITFRDLKKKHVCGNIFPQN